MTTSLQDVEQMSNQVLTVVGQNGKQTIHREWERVQVKSHQIHTTILKVELTNTTNSFLIKYRFRSNNNYKIVLPIG